LHSPITGLGCRCEFITEASSSEVGREVAEMGGVAMVEAVRGGAAKEVVETEEAVREAEGAAAAAAVAAAAAARAAVC